MTTTLLGSCCNEQPPARMVAGALGHLARHMETGCPRAGHLAAMLLDQVANDAEADAHLRAHARELVDILERDLLLNPATAHTLPAHSSTARDAPRKASARP
jgi:hypothetical protein